MAALSRHEQKEALAALSRHEQKEALAALSRHEQKEALAALSRLELGKHWRLNAAGQARLDQYAFRVNRKIHPKRMKLIAKTSLGQVRCSAPRSGLEK